MEAYNTLTTAYQTELDLQADGTLFKMPTLNEKIALKI